MGKPNPKKEKVEVKEEKLPEAPTKEVEAPEKEVVETKASKLPDLKKGEAYFIKHGTHKLDLFLGEDQNFYEIGNPLVLKYSAKRDVLLFLGNSANVPPRMLLEELEVVPMPLEEVKDAKK